MHLSLYIVKENSNLKQSNFFLLFFLNLKFGVLIEKKERKWKRKEARKKNKKKGELRRKRKTEKGENHRESQRKRDKGIEKRELEKESEGQRGKNKSESVVKQ